MYKIMGFTLEKWNRAMLTPSVIKKASQTQVIFSRAKMTPNTTSPIAEPKVIFTSRPSMYSSIGFLL